MHALFPREKEVCLKGQSDKHLLEANGGFLSLMHVLPRWEKEVCLKGQSHKQLLETNSQWMLPIILSLALRGLFKRTVSQAFAGVKCMLLMQIPFFLCVLCWEMMLLLVQKNIQ